MTIGRLLTHLSRFIKWRKPILLPPIDNGWPFLVEGDYYKSVLGDFYELRDGYWHPKDSTRKVSLTPPPS